MTPLIERVKEKDMQAFDVQGIEIQAPYDAVFNYISNPGNLSEWAHAFERADECSAKLVTSQGSVDIGLQTSINVAAGTVDWEMQFPDGSKGMAQSRVTQTYRRTCIYSFVLHAPPVPLEQLEGALEVQRRTLRAELARLKALLEAH